MILRWVMVFVGWEYVQARRCSWNDSHKSWHRFHFVFGLTTSTFQQCKYKSTKGLYCKVKVVFFLCLFFFSFKKIYFMQWSQIQWVWFILKLQQMYSIYCAGGTFILLILTMWNETKPWSYLYAVSCFRRSLYPNRTRFSHLDACCRLDRTCGINYNAQLLGFPSGIIASVHSNATQSKHHAAFSPWDYRLCFH